MEKQPIHGISKNSMRRSAKEINKRSDIENIIKKSLVCRLGLCKENIPYIVPVSFGFDGANIYIHTAPEGRKIEFWMTNNLVCFEFEYDVKTIENNEKACKWTASFESVIGYGKIAEIMDDVQKTYALNQIMLQYSGKEWDYSSNDLKGLKVWKIEILEISGKKS